MPGTGGAIAAPASETLATGLEEGIEYEARKRWRPRGRFFMACFGLELYS